MSSLFFECCANEYFKAHFKGIVARVSPNLKQFERDKLFSTGVLQLIQTNISGIETG